MEVPADCKGARDQGFWDSSGTGNLHVACRVVCAFNGPWVRVFGQFVEKHLWFRWFTYMLSLRVGGLLSLW